MSLNVCQSKLLKKENKNICTISRNLIFINIKYIYMCTSTFSSIRLSFIDQYFIFSIAIKLHENGLDFYRNFQAAWWSERILGSKTRYVGFWFLLDICYPRSTFYFYGAESRGTPRNPKFLKIFLMIPWFFSCDKTGSYSIVRDFLFFFISK